MSISSLSSVTKASSPALEAELERIVHVLIASYQPQAIWLFGSAAAQQLRADSDIDLVILKDTDKSFWERLIEVYYLLKPRHPVDILVYTPEEWEDMAERDFFRAEVITKGKLLYESQG